MAKIALIIGSVRHDRLDLLKSRSVTINGRKYLFTNTKNHTNVSNVTYWQVLKLIVLFRRRRMIV
jgi:hypothetical protein